MGRTLAPFRIALENEIESWKSFLYGLRPGDRKYFDQIMSAARNHSDAGSLAARPLLSEIIFMGVLIEQQKRLEDLATNLEMLTNTVNLLGDLNKHGAKSLRPEQKI